jgi:hypothetical protein
MRTKSKLLTVGVVAIVAGALGWNALAATSMHGAPWMLATGSMRTGMMGCGGLDSAAYLGSVKQQLSITQAQEDAWAAYTKSVQDTMASLWTQHGNAMKAMHDSSDSQAVMSQMQDQHQQAVQALRTAADKLLATLDDSQKQKAQEVLPGLASGGPGLMAETGMMGMMNMMNMGRMR